MHLSLILAASELECTKVHLKKISKTQPFHTHIDKVRI